MTSLAHILLDGRILKRDFHRNLGSSRGMAESLSDKATAEKIPEASPLWDFEAMMAEKPGSSVNCQDQEGLGGVEDIFSARTQSGSLSASRSRI